MADCHNLMKLHTMQTKALLAAQTALTARPATSRSARNALTRSPALAERGQVATSDEPYCTSRGLPDHRNPEDGYRYQLASVWDSGGRARF